MTSTVLSGLEPAAVFHWFEQISAIPRGSGHTAAISQFCVDFAAQRGLRCCRDRTNSVVLYKDASPGYEDHPTAVQAVSQPPSPCPMTRPPPRDICTVCG